MFSRVRGHQRLIVPIRNFSCTSKRQVLDVSNMAVLLQRSIRDVEARMATIEANRVKKKGDKEANKKESERKHEEALTAELLNNLYRSEFSKEPTISEMSSVNSFFLQSHVQLDWMSKRFIDMPGEQQRADAEQQKLDELEEERKSLNDLRNTVNFDNDEVTFDEYDEMPHKEQKRVLEHSSGFVKPGITPGLPEVVFLGKCNVGKSSLLNALMTPIGYKSVLEYAFASKVAGYTKTMNAFNVGNRLRIIDTPGYGVKGQPAQGKQILEYLQNRKELRKVYVLIGAFEGFHKYDDDIIDFLFLNGIPFEVVFTKIDKLKRRKTIAASIKRSGILNGPMVPELLFTAADKNRKVERRQGLSELRRSILTACGLPFNLKPLTRRDKPPRKR